MFCFVCGHSKGRKGLVRLACLDQSLIQWSSCEGSGVSLGPSGCPGPVGFVSGRWTHIAGRLQGGQTSLFLLNIAVQSTIPIFIDSKNIYLHRSGGAQGLGLLVSAP